MQKAILGQVACDPVPERRAGRSAVLGVSSMKCAARTQSPPPNWDTVSPAACFTASPAPLSSPVYFTGLVPAAIFPIRGAIPALILVERMVRRGGKSRPYLVHTPPASPLFSGRPPSPAHRATLLSSRSSACIQMGLLSPGERKGVITSLPLRPLLVGLDIRLGRGRVVPWKDQGWALLNKQIKNNPQTLPMLLWNRGDCGTSLCLRYLGEQTPQA